jgi:hypothetical protein
VIEEKGQETSVSVYGVAAKVQAPPKLKTVSEKLLDYCPTEPCALDKK